MMKIFGNKTFKQQTDNIDHQKTIVQNAEKESEEGGWIICKILHLLGGCCCCFLLISY